jgi:uncharacterized membrane protein YdjX (TVP38/TMEM64 family)
MMSGQEGSGARMMGRRLVRVLDGARRLGLVGPAMVVAAGLPLVGVAVLAAPLVSAAPMLRDAGLAGAAIFAIGAGALAGLSIIPMHLLAILGGWTFALVPGLPAVLAGLLAAAAIGYRASTALAKRRAIDLLEEHPRGAIVHRALVGRGLGRAAVVVALLRLSPVMPFAATNLAMAALRVPFRAFMIGTIAGMLPRVAGGVLMGTGLARVDPRAPADSWPAAAGIAATVIALVVIGRMANRALSGVDDPRAAAAHDPEGVES